MDKTSIAAIALASTLALLATGCDRRDEATPGERGADTSMGTSDTTTGMGDTATAPDQMASNEPIGSTADSAGQAIDDAAITTAVKGKYLVDDTLKGLDISVDTEQGVVRLSGTVQTEAAKEQATRLAQTVDGVVNVDNQLTVMQQ
jgi:osmotically-inducible protein OsmY